MRIVMPGSAVRKIKAGVVLLVGTETESTIGAVAGIETTSIVGTFPGAGHAAETGTATVTVDEADATNHRNEMRAVTTTSIVIASDGLGNTPLATTTPRTETGSQGLGTRSTMRIVSETAPGLPRLTRSVQTTVVPVATEKET